MSETKFETMATASATVPMDTSDASSDPPPATSPGIPDETALIATLTEFNYPSVMNPTYPQLLRSSEMYDTCLEAIEANENDPMTTTLREVMTRGGRTRLMSEYKCVRDSLDVVNQKLKGAQDNRREILLRQMERIEAIKTIRGMKAQRKEEQIKKEKAAAEAAEKAKQEEAAREKAKQQKATEELQRQMQTLAVQQQQQQQQQAENQKVMQMLMATPNFDQNMLRLFQQQQQQQQQQVTALPGEFQQLMLSNYVQQQLQQERQRQMQLQQLIIQQQQQQIQRQQQVRQQLLAQLPPGLDPNLTAMLLNKFQSNPGTPQPK